MKTKAISYNTLGGMLRPKAILMLLFVALSVAACKKDDDGDDDDTDEHSHSHTEEYEATINIKTPDQNMYMNGDNLDMVIDFTNDATIHNVSVTLINLSNNNTEEYTFDDHVHQEDGSYTFTHTHTLSVTTHTNYRLVAKTWDHSSDATPIEKTHEFHVMP